MGRARCSLDNARRQAVRTLRDQQTVAGKAVFMGQRAQCFDRVPGLHASYDITVNERMIAKAPPWALTYRCQSALCAITEVADRVAVRAALAISACGACE
jgi:hypothetical protein